MNLPAYFLLFGLAIWGIAITSALSGSVENCGGLKPNDRVLYNGYPAKVIKRTGPWGGSCNYWIAVKNKELVANVKHLSSVNQQPAGLGSELKKFIYIPIFILMWLPESLQIKYAKIVWSRKQDAHILYAYENCIEWKTVGVESITFDCEEKLKNYIIPEIERRGLDVPQLRSLQSRADEHLVDAYRRRYPEIYFN